jgi:hypothetical protein
MALGLFRTLICRGTADVVNLGLLDTGIPLAGAQTMDYGLASPTQSTMDARVQAAYGQLPLSFESNIGQANPATNFLARGHGFSLCLDPTVALLTLRMRHQTPRLAFQINHPAPEHVRQCA